MSSNKNKPIQDDSFLLLRHNLLQSSSWINDVMRQTLQPFDITPKQYNILRLLADREPESLSIQDVRDRLADKMSDASRLIDRLHRKGLIDKYPSDTDRRSNRARIEKRGIDLLVKIEKSRKKMDQSLNGLLNEEEIDALIGLLERIR